MIPQRQTTNSLNSIDKLQIFTDAVNEKYFNSEDIDSLSERQVMERYKLAKEILLKEMDSVIKTEKEYKDIKPEEQLLLNAINSMNPEEKKQLKEAILKIRGNKK